MPPTTMDLPVDPFAPPRRLHVLQDEPLSVSRIRKDGQCPKAFQLSYVLHRHRDERILTDYDEELGDSSKVGTVCHGALESACKEVLAFGETMKMSEADATRHFRAAFIESDLRDEAAYTEGLHMVRNYLERHPIEFHKLIPIAEGGGIERKFLLRAAEFQILGYIDLIERVEPGHYEVVDYKTGKWLFSEDDLAKDIQLSTYGWAVRQLFPDAKKITYRFEMLRHGVAQRTTRTEEQCIEAVRYLVDRARQIETRTEFPAVIGQLCSWCNVRQHCDTYARAHDPNETDPLIGLVTTDDVDRVSEARSVAYGIAKLAEKRYKTLDGIIMAKLKAMGVDEVRTEDGWKYRTVQRTTNRYNLDKVLRAFEQAGVARDKVEVPRFVKIVKEELDGYLDTLETMTDARKKMLKVALSATGDPEVGRPFLEARQVKG